MTDSAKRSGRADAGTLGQVAALSALLALAAWLGSLHDWPAWAPPSLVRGAWACALVVAYAGLCTWTYRRIRITAGQGGGPARRDAVWIVHASQTGFAENLAAQTAASLRAAGVPVRLEPLGRVDAAGLARTRRVLFVASTTGEGDAPDSAIGFLRAFEQMPDLAGVQYGLLALGDSSYANFCAFGRRLDAWLRHAGATPLFDAVEVDDGDDGALRHWQHHVGLLAGRTDLPDWTPPRYEHWRLRARRETNPGSVGGACFHIELEPEGALPQWRAGDLVEIGPRHARAAVERVLAALGFDGAAHVRKDGEECELRDLLARSAWPDADAAADATPQALADRLRALPHREYSIASIPADRAIHLLVRRLQQADGSPGLGSGWLTEHARIGDAIALRVRTNANFHAPADDRPLILIGNGSGIAGLRALLKERVAANRRRNWLLFGERNAACDFHYRGDIERWSAQGFIERVDLAFSRDQAERVHVQDRLAAVAPLLREWVGSGAAIHVCGSLEGMAPGVHAVLLDVLGAAQVERLQVEGRYRRDVY